MPYSPRSHQALKILRHRHAEEHRSMYLSIRDRQDKHENETSAESRKRLSAAYHSAMKQLKDKYSIEYLVIYKSLQNDRNLDRA